MSKANAWLEDPIFLNKIDFEDKIYFQMLAKEVSNYVKNAPIPLITWWEAEEKKIYFMIGQKIKWWLNVDVNVSYKDSITKVEKYARKLYPQYTVEYEVETTLNSDEVIETMRSEGISLEEALNRTTPTLKKEHGIIERVFKKEDRFILTVDGISTLRMSGIPAQRPMSITEFLEELKRLNFNRSSGEEIREFIFDNSVEHKILPKKTQVIEYEDLMMLNLFDINFASLKE